MGVGVEVVIGVGSWILAVGVERIGIDLVSTRVFFDKTD